MRLALGSVVVGFTCLLAGRTAQGGEDAGPGLSAAAALVQVGVDRGVAAVLGLPDEGPTYVVDLARGSHLAIYFQSPHAREVAAVREAAEEAGLLGTRIFADEGSCVAVHLADNLADAVLVAGDAGRETPDEELLRVLHPEGVAVIGPRRLVKPIPQGIDSWSHVFHGPDNNPLSTDQLARAPYATQFLADPKFCPMPEVSVAAGGRIFRAFGHIAHKANQNSLLNTLLAINGYNGTSLWQRPLREGFMIHRNTMVATPEVLYLADDRSCQKLDARSGEDRGEIRVPEGLGDGPVWKWMALEGGVLYALTGGVEVRPATQRSNVPGMGHWPWGMWEGHEYADPKTSFGFGRTLAAFHPADGKLLWAHHEPEYLDARGLCMKNGRIYGYAPRKFVVCLDAATGRVLWRNSDADLLDAIGADGAAQHYLTGYATTTFLKCTDRYLFFAGPQRRQLVAASTEDGRLLWHREPGNLQMVLRDDCIYAAGEQGKTGFKLSYTTGETVSLLAARRACTRATGSVDSVFFRASGGTVRIDVRGGRAQHIAPMRPPCQDGVIISDGLLSWGPWMCGCQLSFYGHVGLAPAQKIVPATDRSPLVLAAEPGPVQALDVRPGDWPTYLADNARSGAAKAPLPRQVTRRWTYRLPGKVRPTASIAAGGLVFLGDEGGAIRALDARDGTLRWRTHTGGAIFFPPALAEGRLFAGSADGRVWCLEAATGRVLWCFLAAPADRRIPVYGKLISTWPVAGGVVAADGVVYAAAGIAHYDGTYVYALDARTGQVKWCNDTSGRLSEEVDSGVSLQGDLYVAEGELRFLGGGKYETARFDLRTGRCLNTPDNTLASQFRTAFSPYYPEHGRYLSLAHTMADGRELAYDASYDGSQHGPLSLLAPPAQGTQASRPSAARWPVSPRPHAGRQALWSDKTGRRFHAFVVSPDILIAAGHLPGAAQEHFLAAIDVATGADLWREPLPAASVRGGVAMNHEGQLVVSLEDGSVQAFVPSP